MRIWKIVGVSALALGTAFPVLADIDVPNLTCGDFIAMPNADRNLAAQAVANWADQSGSSVEGCLISMQVKDKSLEEVHLWIEARCEGQPVDLKVVEFSLQASMMTTPS